jgi:hypothetical protein
VFASFTSRKAVFPRNLNKHLCILVIGGFAPELERFYTAFRKSVPAGISGCRKKRLNNGTFF